MIMTVYEWFCFRLIVINITGQNIERHVSEQHITDGRVATYATSTCRVINCLINSTNTSLVYKIYILECGKIFMFRFVWASATETRRKLCEKRFHFRNEIEMREIKKSIYLRGGNQK